MILHRAALLWLTLIPLVVVGQPPNRVTELRNKAMVEGSVEIKVTTRAVADAPSRSRTQAQRVTVQFAQCCANHLMRAEMMA